MAGAKALYRAVRTSDLTTKITKDRQVRIIIISNFVLFVSFVVNTLLHCSQARRAERAREFRAAAHADIGAAKLSPRLTIFASAIRNPPGRCCRCG